MVMKKGELLSPIYTLEQGITEVIEWIKPPENLNNYKALR